MTKQKRKVLEPGYYGEFSCIGAECEDTCCQGWTVAIDQKTYKKYKNLRDKELSPLIQKNIKRVRTNSSGQNYAVIVLDEESRCPFLNEQLLCSFQAKWGEGYLSNVCSQYPRIVNKVNDSVERSTTLSCPETARLALLNPNKMVFIQKEEELESTILVSGHLQTNDEQNPVLNIFWDLRVFTIELLQNRTYSLEDRLIILGIFYDRIQQSIDKLQYDELSALIASYRDLIDAGTLRESLSEIPTSIDIQLQITKKLVDIRLQLGLKQKVYIECTNETLAGIQYAEDKSLGELVSGYKEAYTNYYLPFMNDHQYIYENYLVNYVFKNLFPFCSDESRLYDEYVRMVLHFAMIKLHLIGMAGYHKEHFSLEHVVRLIYSFARAIEHSPTYLYKLMKILHEKEQTSLAHMAILIKN